MSLKYAKRFTGSWVNIDNFCKKAADFVSSCDLKQLNFSIQILLRETLSNSFMHGKESNGEVYISCSIIISNKKIIIKVHDNGDGFDWKKKIYSKCDAESETGRGLCIYKKYTDYFIFNKKGNKIKFILNRK